jgi:hypothetical protein
MEEHPLWVWTFIGAIGLVPLQEGISMRHTEPAYAHNLLVGGIVWIFLSFIGLIWSFKRPLTDLQAFRKYLKRKISEAEKIKSSVTVRNQKEKADAIWRWEEGLSKGLVCAFGEQEAHKLLGRDKNILHRKYNWHDTEGQWIYYRSEPPIPESVVVFKHEIEKILDYLAEKRESTLSHHFVNTFSQGDLDMF